MIATIKLVSKNKVNHCGNPCSDKKANEIVFNSCGEEGARPLLVLFHHAGDISPFCCGC